MSGGGHVRKMTDAKIEITLAMHNAGKSPDDISTVIAVSRQVVVRVLNGTYYTRDSTNRHRPKREIVVVGRRRCLQCRNQFNMEWRGQWICVPCRRLATWHNHAVMSGRAV